MLLKTILNFVTHYKSFRFGKVSFEQKDTTEHHIVAEIYPRKNGKAVCSQCGKVCPTYDTTCDPRWFEFVPLWNIPVWFIYRMRRVRCPAHGVTIEQDA